MDAGQNATATPRHNVMRMSWITLVMIAAEKELTSCFHPCVHNALSLAKAREVAPSITSEH